MNELAYSGSLGLTDQVAVVTGGARGIGVCIVERFVEEGARVVFSDLLDDKAEYLENELGKNTVQERYVGGSQWRGYGFLQNAFQHLSTS